MKKLPFATNSNIEIVKFATEALCQIFKEGYKYKRAGVMVLDICNEKEIQPNFFDNSDPRHASLMHVVDNINKAYGDQKIRLAVQSTERIWKMKQDHRSPLYTTDIRDVMIIKAGE